MPTEVGVGYKPGFKEGDYPGSSWGKQMTWPIEAATVDANAKADAARDELGRAKLLSMGGKIQERALAAVQDEAVSLADRRFAGAPLWVWAALGIAAIGVYRGR